MQNLATDERLLNVGEVATWLGVRPAWVRAHAVGARKPILPSIKLGKERRFQPNAVKAWIEERRLITERTVSVRR